MFFVGLYITAEIAGRNVVFLFHPKPKPQPRTENRASLLSSRFLTKNKSPFTCLISNPSPMPTLLCRVFLVFMIVCVHTLPQNSHFSTDLLVNNDGVLDESNSFNEADPVSDKTNHIFDQENLDVLNADKSDAFDGAYANILVPENSDVLAGGLSESPGSNPTPGGDPEPEPVPLPPSPPPPYYCENGRRAACCGEIYFRCVWWHKFTPMCQSEKRWACCLKIDYIKPNWGVDCTVGYLPFETYAPNGDKVPAGETTPPSHDPVPVPEHAPDAIYLPLPEYESPGKSCPIRGAIELDKCVKSGKPSW